MAAKQRFFWIKCHCAGNSRQTEDLLQAGARTASIDQGQVQPYTGNTIRQRAELDATQAATPAAKAAFNLMDASFEFYVSPAGGFAKGYPDAGSAAAAVNEKDFQAWVAKGGTIGLTCLELD